MKEEILDHYYCAYCAGKLIKSKIIGKNIKLKCEYYKKCPYVITISRDLIAAKEKEYSLFIPKFFHRFKPLFDRTNERKINKAH